MVVKGVDVDHGDAQLLEPLAADGAFEGRVDAARRLRVARPEDDHLAFLEAVLDGAVALRRAEVHRLAPVVHGAPVPPLPAIRIMADRGPADVVEEPQAGAQPVAQDAPQVMGAAAVEDGAGAVVLLDPLDLARHDVERLVPADPLVAGDAPVLRVPLALRVEIDPLHRVEEPVRGVDHRLEDLRVGGDGRLPGRREGSAPGVDRPGGRVLVVELDGRDAEDPPVLDVDEDGPAVRVARVARDAVAHVRPVPDARVEHEAQGLHEPARSALQVLRAPSGSSSWR